MSRLPIKVISTVMAEKLVWKRCETFLPFVHDSTFVDSSLGDIQIAREFSDIFPKELLRLPPNIEVEFGIEILLSIALVSIAPYRIALKKPM